jgi:hypothetical protein
VCPECNISDLAQATAKKEWLIDGVATHCADGILHIWLEPDVKPSFVAREIGRGLSELLHEEVLGTGKSYADVTEAAFTLVDILKNSGRI